MGRAIGAETAAVADELHALHGEIWRSPLSSLCGRHGSRVREPGTVDL